MVDESVTVNVRPIGRTAAGINDAVMPLASTWNKPGIVLPVILSTRAKLAEVSVAGSIGLENWMA